MGNVPVQVHAFVKGHEGAQADEGGLTEKLVASLPFSATSTSGPNVRDLTFTPRHRRTAPGRFLILLSLSPSPGRASGWTGGSG